MYQLTSKSNKTILLRPPQSGDTQIMLDYINGIGLEDIYVNANPEELYTIEQEQNYLISTLKSIEANRKVAALAFHETRLIGSCDVTKGEKRTKHTGVFGITLSQKYRSDGIGFQLAQYTLQQAKETLDIKLVTLRVYAPNKPAINMYNKLGFKQYGYLPQGLSYKGDFIDEILMYKALG